MLIGGALAIFANDLSEIADWLFSFAEQAEDLNMEFGRYYEFHAPNELKEWLNRGCRVSKETREIITTSEGIMALDRLAEFFDGGNAMPHSEKMIAFEVMVLKRLGIKGFEELQLWRDYQESAGEEIGNFVEWRERIDESLEFIESALCNPAKVLWKRTPARDAIREVAETAKDGAILVADIAVPALVPDITLMIGASSVRSIWKSGSRLLSRAKRWLGTIRRGVEEDAHEAIKNIPTSDTRGGVRRRPLKRS